MNNIELISTIVTALIIFSGVTKVSKIIISYFKDKS